MKKERPRLRRTKGCLFLRCIPDDVKAKFKSTTYRRGNDMQKVCIALMKLYVKNPRVVDDFLDRQAS